MMDAKPKQTTEVDDRKLAIVVKLVGDMSKQVQDRYIGKSTDVAIKETDRIVDLAILMADRIIAKISGKAGADASN